MNQNDIERDYQLFYAKLLKKVSELKDDFNKLSNTNKLRFEKDIKIILKVEFPNLIEFLQNDWHLS